MEEAISKLVRKHNKLLLLEREENLQNFFQDLSPATIHNLEKSGQALTKLKVTNVAGKGPERFQIDLERSDELPFENSLSQGDLVICIQSNQKGQSIRGIVTDVSDTTLSISSNDNFNNEIQEEDIFSVIKTDSDFTYKCQTRALSNLEKREAYSSRCLDLIRILFDKDKNAVGPLLTAELPIPEKFLNPDKLLNFANKSLADDQKSAVEFALKRRYFAIIQGPPGTGKTTTLVELVVQLYRLGKKVLICAPTNVAVDNMVIKLGETEAKPLRLGHPTRIMKAALKFSLDACMQRDDGYVILQDIKRLIKDLETNASSGKGRNYKEIRDLNKEYRKRLNKLTHDVLRKFSVILCTLNSSSSNEGYLHHVAKDHFNVLIVDEASQAMEASMWVAIPNAPKLVLAGDINQLPPVVMCQEAANQGLNMSLMERAIKKLGKDSFRCLTRQYRMNEKIMLWSSKRFYENSLQADASVKHHLLKDLPGVREIALTNESLVFIDTCGCECEEYQTVAESGSKGNVGEAAVVNKVVSSLIRCGLSDKSIGVITPYALQVDLIRRSLISHSLPVEVSTVDGFQGREKEVIILSLVRSNLEKELGFVTDFRRLNVAVTRARRLLVVIGDSETVEKNDVIVSLLTHIEENGLLETAEEYLSAADNVESEIEKTSQKNIKKKSKAALSKKEEEKKVVENVKVDSKVKEEIKAPKKLSDKGIDLSSCQNRKGFNIFETIAADEPEDKDEVDPQDKTEQMKSSKSKKKKEKLKVQKELKQEKREEDFDQIIAEFSQSNYVCAHEGCKISTQLIHLNCEFCKKRFCLEHGMQEIHGCGDAVRRKERKEFRHRKPEPAKKKDKDKFAQKLKQLEEARKPKTAKEDTRKSKKK